MTHFINAFCYCVRGGRPNNEDNFYLNGKFLEQDNEGLNSVISANRVGRKNFASVVFDGMGGESCGEVASYTAAKMMGDNYSLKLVGNVERDIEVISKLTFELNDACNSFQKIEKVIAFSCRLCFAGRDFASCGRLRLYFFISKITPIPPIVAPA